MNTDHAPVHIPPPLFWVAAIASGALLKRWLPLTIGWGPPRVFVAVGFVLAWALLMFWSFGWFLLKRTTIIPNRPANTLIVEGPFRLTRNPLYVAMTLLTIGVGLWLNTWWVLILLGPVIVVVNGYVIAREEAYLRRRFGAQYDAYASRVRRWF